MVDGFNGSIQQMINNFTKNDDSFTKLMENGWKEIENAAENYRIRLEEVESKSRQPLTNLKTNEDNVYASLKSWVDENDKVIANSNTSIKTYNDIASSVKALADKYEKTKENAEKATTESTELQKKLNEETWKRLEAQKALDNLVSKLKEWNNIKPETKTFVTNHVDNYSSSGGGGGGGGGAGGNGASTPAKKYYAYNASTGKKISSTGYSSEALAKRKHPGAIIKTYKTGGYTGSWNGGSMEANGRLAILHQKELVLNEEQTKHFLDGMKLINNFDFNKIESAMNATVKGLQVRSIDNSSNLISRIDHIISSIDRLANVVEQKVDIKAEFTDVRSSYEIEQAFNSLTNRASQAAFNIQRRR